MPFSPISCVLDELAALDHDRAVVVAQAGVDVKTNEIPCFTAVLDQIEDLADVVITVDAMHAQTGHATCPHARRAHLLVTVKRNQPALHQRLKTLPWKDVPVGHTARGRARGRIEKRALKAVTVPAGLGFPHAAQAIQVVRRTRRINPAPGKRARWHTETVYAICTLPAQDAQPAELAAWIRGHWRIKPAPPGARCHPWRGPSIRPGPAAVPRSWPFCVTS
jgi:predicted transposase YbfD/YdcC